MKKNMIAIILVIIVIIAIYTYITKKSSKPKIQPIQEQKAQSTEQDQNISQQIQEFYKSQQANIQPQTSNENQTVIPTTQTYYTGTLPSQYTQMTDCNKTIDDIIKERGKYWGEIKVSNPKDGKVKIYSIPDEEEDKIELLLSSLLFCDNTYILNCERDGKCKKNIKKFVEEVKFYEYITGSNSDEKVCENYISKTIPQAISKNLSPKQICKLLKGTEIKNICNKINSINNLNPLALKKCYSKFPPDIDINNVSYTSCKTPCETLRDESDMLRCIMCIIKSKDKQICKEIEQRLILTYCDAFNKIKQREEMEKQKKEMNDMMKKQREEMNKQMRRKGEGDEE